MNDDSPTDFETAKERWHRAVRYAESVKFGKAEAYTLARAESQRLARAESQRLAREAVKRMEGGGEGDTDVRETQGA